MPANDTTVVAQWTEVEAEIESEYVEIVFGRKDMTEEEVKEIIKRYIDEEFTIEKFEEDKKAGETKVIIRFEDAEKAKDFVRSVSEGRASSNNIKSVRTVPAEQDSFALKVNVMSMTIFLILYFMCAAPV